MKYQSSSSHCSKVHSKVKVSDRFTEWQTGQKQYTLPIFDITGIKIYKQKSASGLSHYIYQYFSNYDSSLPEQL